MFIGHFAVGFAAKRAVPRASLAVLFAAAQFADLLWPVLVAIGAETVRIAPGTTAFTPLDFVSYPWSHSLVMLVIWGVAFGAVTRPRGNSATALFVIVALVVSHWILDFITHRPDMPLYPGGPTYGLGLWNSVGATLIVELAMFAAGVAVYTRSTRALDATGKWSFFVFVLFLLLVYGANIIGGPPPSVTAVWVAGLLGGVLLMVWSWWFDRHRSPAPTTG